MSLNYYAFTDEIERPHREFTNRLIDSMVNHYDELRVWKKYEEADALRNRLARFHVVIETPKGQNAQWKFQ